MLGTLHLPFFSHIYCNFCCVCPANKMASGTVKIRSTLIPVIIVIIILLKFHQQIINLSNLHIAKLIGAGCITYNKS